MPPWSLPSARRLPRLPPARTHVAALGALTFCACALLPSIHRATLLPRSAFVLLSLPPLLLAAGLALARERRTAASYLLLTGFPMALAVSVSRLEHDVALTTFSPSILGFSFLSLGAYAASAVALCAAPLGTRKVEQRPLGEVAPIEPEARKQVVGAVVLWTLLIGTLFVTMWGSWASPSQYREQWGRAAAEGATLTALAGGFAGSLMLALVGPALRADRSTKTRDERTRRLTWLLSVAASGGLVYAFLSLR
ncbi:MAG: hypothetical protein JWN48_3386 [Myxococcaceae bacterium]|nr:hypothetical protein [Myxococcaceae bacterium]